MTDWATSLNSIVINYFNDYLPSFILKNQTSHGPHWGVKYINEDLEINIAGDIGFSIEISIDNKIFKLWQYDKNVNNWTTTNEKNILLQLDALKRFLNDEGPTGKDLSKSC